QRLLQGFGLLEQAVRDALGVAEEGSGPAFAVRLALLPSLCEARIVELPPVGPAETDALLRRNATRYFLAGGRDLVVGGSRFPGSDDGSGPVLVAAAPSDLLEAARAAVESRGWTLESVTPAHAAWLAVLEQRLRLAGDGQPEAGSGPVRLLIADGGGTAHLVRYEGRSLGRLRRVPLEDLDSLVETAG